MHVNPGVLRWVALVSVLAVFVLSFFPWLGRYPGGVALLTQSAWQSAFGSVTEEEGKPLPKELKDVVRPPSKEEEAPGASGLMIVYVLLLVLLLLLTLAAVVWDLLPTALPPALQQLRPWRWGLVAGVGVLALALLVLEEAVGFSLENRVTATVDTLLREDLQRAAAPGASDAVVKRAEILRGMALAELRRTTALTAATALSVLAVLAALLVVWVERRGARPRPRVDALW
jgi:hypothetical protein